jgi:hypothetical protein
MIRAPTTASPLQSHRDMKNPAVKKKRSSYFMNHWSLAASLLAAHASISLGGCSEPRPETDFCRKGLRRDCEFMMRTSLEAE